MGGNMATEKLYMGDIKLAYNTRFNAKVTSVNENKITLDRTLFYPIGGGQNWDTGIIEGPTGELNVHEVRGRNSIEHFVESDHQLSIGDEVIGTIDWDRRYAHMRMHTAQHLMSGIAYELFNGVRTVGNQIHSTHSRIDFNPISFNEELMQELSNKANEKISQSIGVTSMEMTRDEINSIMPEERTNMDLIPKFVNDLRIIKIGNNLDLCPCAGTHIGNLSEIGTISIVNKKSKGKGTQRITYEISEPELVQNPNNSII